jgi:hypothetical protein
MDGKMMRGATGLWSQQGKKKQLLCQDERRMVT